ncbi:MAG: oligosaccharide repeat unit polymerase [Rhodocyclaceae bacterium]|nr:oligosaccharide repeat unit polymerase [Rhodocyclaceae bacterium]MCA3038626.1 oligosaccharide repeat unit polymerase [Rhodocyclaceae bacterium]MCA3047165.1 oligosaccharide repeat unit polymerase [Rhodocyclaceae bacterium]MCA3050910.1 oligosaccharide repeat unit polymerase [Rhodocyclaceae bacterium]MCA3056344.1 oligosaccharide repeat unit polymerase [Rhodocyclaceae bacterium]
MATGIQPSRQQVLSSLILVPSFYGFVAWSFCLALYSLRLIDWYESPPGAMWLYVGVALAFGTSSIVYAKAYAITKHSPEFDYTRRHMESDRSVFLLSRVSLWALHILGFIGLYLHFSQVVTSLSSMGGLVAALLGDSQLIRKTDVDPSGIHVSYFGWLAIPLTVLAWRIDRRGMALLLVAAALQFLANMMFIDRTRPTWLILATLIIWLPFAKELPLRSIMGRSVVVVLLLVGLFLLIGYWIGKRGGWFDAYGHVSISNDLALIYYYLTGGFAYFDILFDTIHDFAYVPERTLYPLFKFGEMLGLTAPPPSQILPFIDAPFPTNTGTMLEPLFADGGLLFVFFGTIGATFVVDFVGLLCLRAKNAFCLVFWANLCVVSCLAYFVPKQNSTQVWLFAAIALVGFLVVRFRGRSQHLFIPAPSSAVLSHRRHTRG